MQRFGSVLLAAGLITGIAAFGPAPAQAVDWCHQCDLTSECFACCRCGGGGAGSCIHQCALSPEASLPWSDEAPACTTVLLITADDEAVSAADTSVPAGGKASRTDEPTPVATR
jgi:hypothetical protein